MLIDSFQRHFSYLRLSVTDRCNFQCRYCLPEGYSLSKSSAGDELSILEIQRLVKAFAKIGFRKIRLTGGEPSLRRDLPDIVRAVSSEYGIEEVGLTTNGYRLRELAVPLRQAGLTSLNISLDSLDQDAFNQITGTRYFTDVKEGIEQAFLSGFSSIKINAVLFKKTGAQELIRFMEWVKNRPVSVRFIELMKTGAVSKEFFDQHHITAGWIQFELQKSGWTLVKRKKTDGPAQVYAHPDSIGTIGVIAPYGSDFCSGCNRLRVSSRGALRLCLFGEGEFSLRDFLQDDRSQEKLIETLYRIIQKKPETHLLQEGKYGINETFSSIGG